MAIEKTIVIKADTSQAVKSFDDLTDEITKQERELKSLQKIYQDAPASKNQALKKRIDKLTGSIDKQKQAVTKLTKAQKSANKESRSTLGNVRDNGGAIAVLDSLTGGLATRTRDAAEATKLFNFSLKGTRTALIATGIGLFVVAVALVVAHWEDIVDFITQANEKLQKNIDLHNDFVDDLKIQLGFNEQILKSLDLQGKSQEDQLKIKRDLIKATQIELIAANVLLATQLTREKSKARELNIFQKIDNLSRGITTFVKTANEDELAKQKEIADQINANQKSIIDFQILLLELDKKEEEKSGGEVDEKGRPKVSGIGFDAEQSQRDFEAQEEANARKLQQELEFNLGIETIKAESARTQSETQIKWADLTAEAQLGIAGAVLQDVAGLVDRNSVADKGIKIAQTGINTAQGIMQAFATLPTIAAIPAAALVAALGIKSTIDIAKTKIPSATGRGFVGGGAGAGGSAAPAPAFNLVEGTEGSQINESINLQNNEPVEAFVVSTAVTSSQELDRNIVDGSGL